jgi:alpha-1,3-mannosyltransferase
LQGQQHKYFFAINLFNSFDVIPDIFSTLFRTSAILGYHNVFVSIYENGSNDQTKALLRIFDALARTVGLRVIIRTSMRTRGQFNHRIEYLAEVRNAAMVPLHELRDNENEVFDSIVFMNDILPCVDDLLELIWQSRRQNAGITCAADYMYHDDIVSDAQSMTEELVADGWRRAHRCSTTTGSRGTSTVQRSKTPPSSRSSTTQSRTTDSSAICPFKVRRADPPPGIGTLSVSAAFMAASCRVPR